MEDKVYTTADIRRILHISKGQVFKLLHSGDLDFFRIGRSIRVTESALNDYITSHSSKRKDK